MIWSPLDNLLGSRQAPAAASDTGFGVIGTQGVCSKWLVGQREGHGESRVPYSGV